MFLALECRGLGGDAAFRVVASVAMFCTGVPSWAFAEVAFGEESRALGIVRAAASRSATSLLE